MKGEVTLTLEIKANDPFEFKDKKQALEKIAKLDGTTLKNLAQLTGSEKAITKFNANIGFIKTFMV